MEEGRFEGEVRTEWLIHAGPDRRMRLLEDFAFVDSRGQRWVAPAGSVIDGGSIPRILWAVAGSPYAGDYRRASVLHDVACVRRTGRSKDVHRMFYEAMICDGADHSQALEFYTAVRLFGPDWPDSEHYAGLAPSQAAPPPRSIEEVEAALDAVLGE
ncbi:DUF1353 domain-containing protein [Piscinibacter sp.]|uniref:DUF1353 domain-containing protein n=1 Tax=Piscinibacter sp. TaxID=1903157 RepID=UPI002C87BADE|nr:DUF1353 domain-containing protein [Albitalea sp.]HUG21488.1 DUF1353 domain-containing protein [Albitalea sp.]